MISPNSKAISPGELLMLKKKSGRLLRTSCYDVFFACSAIITRFHNTSIDNKRCIFMFSCFNHFCHWKKSPTTIIFLQFDSCEMRVILPYFKCLQQSFNFNGAIWSTIHKVSFACTGKRSIFPSSLLAELKLWDTKTDRHRCGHTGDAVIMTFSKELWKCIWKHQHFCI